MCEPLLLAISFDHLLFASLDISFVLRNNYEFNQYILWNNTESVNIPLHYIARTKIPSLHGRVGALNQLHLPI